jgi:hypothetical protein
MVTRMTTTSSVPRRVLDRTLHGIWRQKGTLLLYSGVVAAMIGYTAFAAQTPASASGKGAQVTTPDCADAVMAAVVGQSAPAVQSQAYQCMGPDLQQHLFQDGLGTHYRTIASTTVSKVSRVGTHAADSGDNLVYYAVDAGDQSVGFVVHLSPDGKVTEVS